MLKSSGISSYGGSKRLEVHYEKLEKKEMTWLRFNFSTCSKHSHIPLEIILLYSLKSYDQENLLYSCFYSAN